MKSGISRRDFLKAGVLALAGLGFTTFPEPNDAYEYPIGMVGRVTLPGRVTIYRRPDWDSEQVGYLNQRDQMVNIYYQVTPPSGPAYNPVWYRIWQGYIHSAYIQLVKYRFNPLIEYIPEGGQIGEITIPYAHVYRFSRFEGWREYYRLYYQTVHWIIGVDEGPDGEGWYRLRDELTKEIYFCPAAPLRLIPDEEVSPISPDVPWEAKRIEVSLQEQTLTAYENNQVVLAARVSTGLNRRPDPDGIPWNTPQGQFNVSSKMPSKHMGTDILTGAPDAYNLPGVPWTCFFHETGVAFHGAYWHNNFGLQMSHGCVNMTPEDARFLFRWTYPVYTLPVEDFTQWEKRGYGTPVHVI